MIEFEYVGTKPEFGTPDAVGFDLVASQTVTLEFGEIRIIPIDLKTAFPKYKGVLFVEKSGMALRGFDVKGGLIDPDYRDSWGVMLRYLPSFKLRPDGKIELFQSYKPDGTVIKSEPFITITAGQKLCNMVVFNNDSKYVAWKAVETLNETARKGGFGSTGK